MKKTILFATLLSSLAFSGAMASLTLRDLQQAEIQGQSGHKSVDIDLGQVSTLNSALAAPGAGGTRAIRLDTLQLGPAGGLIAAGKLIDGSIPNGVIGGNLATLIATPAYATVNVASGSAGDTPANNSKAKLRVLFDRFYVGSNRTDGTVGVANSDQVGDIITLPRMRGYLNDVMGLTATGAAVNIANDFAVGAFTADPNYLAARNAFTWDHVFLLNMYLFVGHA